MSLTFCPEILMEDSPEFMDSMPSLNVNGSNGVFLLRNLGRDEYDEDGGVMEAEQFLGAVLVALAVAPEDHGVKDIDIMDATGQRAIWTLGGRREGYLQEQLLELEVIGTWARDNGRKVQWA